VSTPGPYEAGRIRSIETSSVLVGNRTRDRPARSIVPQPTTLPRRFNKDWFGIQNLIGKDSQIYRQHDDLVSLLSLFQNKESGLKRVMRLSMHWTRVRF
jgi:hypothetical protein